MGAPMARTLLEAGWRVVVHALPPSPIDELVAAGAQRAADPARVAAEASVVITSLPGADEVRAVVLGERGIAAGVGPGAVVVDTSTISPRAARELAADLGALGLGFLDAPVSGGPAAAATGMLSIMAGGSPEDLRRARDVLDTLGEVVVHCGPPGTGQVCKACNQLVVMASLEVVAEALLLATASGLDPAIARRALLGGYAASRVLELHGDRMLRRDFVPGGRAKFNLKDIDTIGALADEAGLGLPAFDVAATQIRALIDAGGGDLDNAALVTVLEAATAGLVLEGAAS